jgi:hypothetical protein
MSTATRTPEGTSERAARLELADSLFHDFYASCFWHLRPDLAITEERVQLVIEGLRRHGGKRGLLAAAELLALEAPSEPCR